jgi:exodeoxyribonuclease-1
LPVPLKLIHINRCPVVAPLSVLRADDQQRLGLDMALYQARALRLSDAQQVWQDKVTAIYASEDFTPSEDPEQQLYDGFIGDRDRRLCEQVRTADPAQLAQEQWPFDDERLPELLFRYRARNFPDTLNFAEQERWRIFCQQRLSEPQWARLIPCNLSPRPRSNGRLMRRRYRIKCSMSGRIMSRHCANV